MIHIDGAEGEGGGQILRSALALAIHTQQPFRISRIRANREKPGLMRQHLTAVKAAAEICTGVAEGAELGAQELVFRPGPLRGGRYSFAIGTAGSCTLVLQTVLPALLMASEASEVVISGGTHNRGSPPFDFLQRAFLPLLARMGAAVEIELLQPGFYPRGGGQIRARITPARLMPLGLHERGAAVASYAEAYIAALPIHIAQRELDVVGEMLHWPGEQLLLRGLSNDLGPGNALTITLQHENVTEVFSAFGERGVRAEVLAKDAALEALRYLAGTAPVDAYLADQLLLPLVLAGSGSFTAMGITPHFRSNVVVIERFTDRRVHVQPAGENFRVLIS
jgi:RNA 3'-terminal phosphate cyclase (ATP)